MRIILLFMLCTVQCAMTIAARLQFHSKYDYQTRRNMIYVFTNLVADFLLLYRPYVIWSRKKAIIVLPVLLILVGTGISLYALVPRAGAPTTNLVFGEIPFGSLDTRSPLFINLTTNVILTLLTAGGIWWTSLGVRKTLGRNACKSYETAVALIVESGLVYSISVVVYLACISAMASEGQKGKNIEILINDESYSTSTFVTETIFSALTQIVGIIPTLIVVRVGLGLGIKTERSTPIGNLESGIRFEHMPSSAGESRV
ncbi:hypothetical protein BDZ94DRAFT_1318863 [Collybia nuda]|uniref:Integral membrane protein n=1 Tax=Collybia nuda TaxID=64659 RepID=A0A9P5YEL6_9AGAR|nr:hypothetical protein BDZ94DRAFT_1318863 [Collybia nuda]